MDVDLDALRRWAEAAAQPHGCRVWDVRMLRERGDLVLRIDIDRAEGVTLADCARVSRDLDARLDVEDVIEPRYLLQVSSTGIERALRREEHYVQSVGRQIRVVMRVPVGGRSNFEGELVGVDGGLVSLATPNGEVALPLADVKRAHWVYVPRELAVE